MNKTKNELSREFLGVAGLNPWLSHDSSSRIQMMCAHIGQALVINGSTERRCQTGMEKEYGKFTFSIKMPVDAEVIKVIERYRSKIGSDTIAFSPQSIVIYENVHTKEIGMLSVPRYCSYHQYFGFEYKAQPAITEVRAGAFIKEGTVLMDSPSISPNGGYRYGTECNVAFMSHPAVSEDGILISRDALQKFSFKTYESRTAEWGNEKFPLNLYGDINNYKPFPDIGDRIRKDGLLMCLRTYDKELAIVDQGIHDLMEPDFIFDKPVYAAGEGGRIIDIRVHHDGRNVGTSAMDVQPEKYDAGRRQFYQEIINEYSRLKHDRGESLRLTPEFHRMIVESLAVLDSGPNKVTKLYRKAPLDEWRVEFVIEYDTIPTIGFKYTDLHG